MTLLELQSNQCRWVTQDHPAWDFCGAPCEGSYCPEHHAICFPPSISTVDDKAKSADARKHQPSSIQFGGK